MPATARTPGPEIITIDNPVNAHLELVAEYVVEVRANVGAPSRGTVSARLRQEQQGVGNDAVTLYISLPKAYHGRASADIGGICIDGIDYDLLRPLAEALLALTDNSLALDLLANGEADA